MCTGIEIKMEIKENQPGAKACYCWVDDVWNIACIDGWQELIFGYYNDDNGEGWRIGVKRNGEDDGRSAFFYQVIAKSLVPVVLDGIEKILTCNGHKIILTRIKQVLAGESTLDNVHELLKETN